MSIQIYIVFITILLTILVDRNLSSSYDTKEVIIVAGNFSIDGQIVNIAQYDTVTKSWSQKHRKNLFLYGASNGVIWDIAVNHTHYYHNSDNLIDKLFIVGAFDTSSETSQIQYCSVGNFDGLSFEKVGEGLCPRGSESSTAMQLHVVVMGKNGDLFVGGSFKSRVWDGHHFANVRHVARFEAATSSWFPLTDGSLLCLNEEKSKVNALAWDNINSILYIGGVFHAMDNTTLTSGLAIWSARHGLRSFPGGGVSLADDSGFHASIKNIAFEEYSQSLFVAGTFQRVNGEDCSNIAVWHRVSNAWKCLSGGNTDISTITAMHISQSYLYLSGWAGVSSTWQGRNWQSPYAIARLDIRGYLENAANPDTLLIRWNDDEVNEDEMTEYYEELHRKKDNYDDDYRETHTKRPKGNHKRRLQNSSSGHTDYQHIIISKPILSANARHRKLNQEKNNNSLISMGVSKVKDSLNSYKGKDNEKNSNNNKMAAHSRSPTHSPSFKPTRAPTVFPTHIPEWDPQWEWLPGFPGGNGPILRITEGKDDWQGYLFISGAFDNLPAVVTWTEKHSKAYGKKGVELNDSANGTISGVTSGLPGSHLIVGLITSVVQVVLPVEEYIDPVDPDDTPIETKHDYTFLILAGCIGVGILMGILVALAIVDRYYKNRDDKGVGERDTILENGIGNGNIGISLNTLSGSGGGAANINFRECFERAMHARHLPTHEALLIINPTEINLSRIIGEGSFGRVWSGQWRNNSVAVKEFVFAQAAFVGGSLQRNNIIEEIVGEAGVMACLRHPKILQLYGCSLTMQAIWIVSELCMKGSLRMILANKSFVLPIVAKLSICMDVADGMLYLHNRSQPIIHRDLKSHNIFITEPTPGHLVAKIGDWGSARAVALSGAKSMTQGVGTACWLSPEVINNAHFSKSSDVYAFGIILWEVYTRQEIYENLTATQIIAKVAHEGLRPSIPVDCPWVDIMTSCWAQNASKRPSFEIVCAELMKLYSSANSSKRNNQTNMGRPNDNKRYNDEEEEVNERTPLTQQSRNNIAPGHQKYPRHSTYGDIKVRKAQTYGGSNSPPLMKISNETNVHSSYSDNNQSSKIHESSIEGVDHTFMSEKTAASSPIPAAVGNSTPSNTSSLPNTIENSSAHLNFDVSDLTGPTYYVMDNESTLSMEELSRLGAGLVDSLPVNDTASNNNSLNNSINNNSLSASRGSDDSSDYEGDKKIIQPLSKGARK